MLIPNLDTPPREQFASLSLSDQDTNPWQQSLDKKPLPEHPSPPQMPTQDSSNAAWASSSAPPLTQMPAQPEVVITSPTTVNSPGWDDEEERNSGDTLTPASDLEANQAEYEGGNAWQDSMTEEQGAGELESVSLGAYLPNEAEWESNLQPQENGIIENAPMVPARPSATEQPPALPPRRSQDEAPSMPSRPVMNNEESASSVTSAGATTRRQKKETYEIKKVTWYDVTASSNPRVSPILVQNANGPCPLLALVNALTLSTPANTTTALVETLRSREQVSLGLLLDAVFDELMSGRRGDAAQELPDVSELYAFLITLHTGMNVNPRFFPPAPTDSTDDPRRSMSHVHPTEREEAIPGTFEETREMRLYSTFSIPLIHGWLPSKESAAYTALKRSARTYEDAQNLMFREEELEEKLQREGLSFEEQSTLEDISTIKAFFSEYSTQLTPYGLHTMTKSMMPGSVAILFRNDHFSTLYRHPESFQLLQLVTDMGYAGHEEVVWESLVDVNGENCEFFSGDFRIVGNVSADARQAVDDSSWTTVSRRGNQGQNAGLGQSQNSTAAQENVISATSPIRPNTEQEDHDLALALQLQDEEEQRHQSELNRRRREAELSEQFIEQQGSQRPTSVQIPVTNRGGGATTRSRGRGRGALGSNSEARPTIPPRRSGAAPPVADPEAGVDVPPPSYEQAATQEAYIPPVNHPAHPSARADGSGTHPPARRQSAYSANSAAFVSDPSTRGGRAGRVNSFTQVPVSRRQSGLTQQQQQERERDCIVM